MAWVQGSPTQELPPSALASPFPEMPTAALPPFWCSVVDLRRLGRWLRPLGAAPTPVLGAATAADPAAGVELGPSAAAAAAPSPSSSDTLAVSLVCGASRNAMLLSMPQTELSGCQPFEMHTDSALTRNGSGRRHRRVNMWSEATSRWLLQPDLSVVCCSQLPLDLLSQ